MRQPSRDQQRRRGLRSVSSGGPGRVDSTRLLAERVSLTTWTLKEPKTIMCNNVDQRCTDSDSLNQLMQFGEIASGRVAVMRVRYQRENYTVNYVITVFSGGKVGFEL